MSLETESTRNAALAILVAEGLIWVRVGKGQRFVVRISGGDRITTALVKTASRGSAIVRADIDDADRAKLSGFATDVSHVLFAIGNKDNGTVETYLVPLREVEVAYRETHRAWRANHMAGGDNTTWVIWFNDQGNQDCNGFHRKWANYRIGSSLPKGDRVSKDAILNHAKPKDGLTIDEAKRRLAVSLGIDPSNIKIVIEC